MIFSNRMFQKKAAKIWRESTEDERVLLVEDFFKMTGVFEKPRVVASKGKPRPKDDKYAYLNIPSDPIYAVYADKAGADASKPKRPPVSIESGPTLSREELNKRKAAIKDTLCCPYCLEKMKKWEVPENPFVSTWDNAFMYICFNDRCPYFVDGWDFMYRQGNRGASYRLMYNPEKNSCHPVPVMSVNTLRDGIVHDRADE